MKENSSQLTSIPSSASRRRKSEQQLLVIPSSATLPTNKRKILTEEEYLQKLEDVIEKNYFPHIPILEKQLEYMDNNESFDTKTLRNIYQELFPTVPLPKVPEDKKSSIQDSSKDYSNMTIPEFFQNYISEDNYSFLKIQEKDLQNFRTKYHWLYDPNPQLLLTNGDSSSNYPALPSSSTNNNNNNNNKQQRAGMLMLYYINDKILTQDEREKLDQRLESKELSNIDTRSNTFDYGQFRVRNQMIFYPELKESEKTYQISDNNNSTEKRNPILPITNQQQQQQLLIEDAVGNFLVPTKPSSKSISNKNMEIVPKLASSSATGSYAKEHLTNEKFIQKSNIYQSGISLIHEVDQYLRGKQHSDFLPPTPLEEPHTPTTISSSETPGNPNLLYPSITGPSSSSSKRNLHENSLVSMSPLPIIGKGILNEPIITWGKLLGPLILLADEKVPERINQSNDINFNATAAPLSHSSATSSSSQLFNPDLPHFYMNPMNEREKLAHQLDQKRLSKSSLQTSSSASSKIFNNKDRGQDSIFRPSHNNSSNKSVISTPSTIGNGSSRRLKLHEMSPAAQLIAQKVQKHLQEKIFK
jgi:hypothetical protein